MQRHPGVQDGKDQRRFLNFHVDKLGSAPDFRSLRAFIAFSAPASNTSVRSAAPGSGIGT
jgi:hypothetical protein